MSEAEGSPLPKSRGDAEGSRRAITFFKRSDFSAVGAARSWNKGPCPLVWKYGRSESSHMKTRLSVIAAVGALAVAIAAQSQLVREQASGKSIAFQDISVIPMDTERVLSHHTVLVRNGKIADVGPSNSVNLPPGTVVIDGRDKFLMPGMADMHTTWTGRQCCRYSWLPESRRCSTWGRLRRNSLPPLAMRSAGARL